MSESPPTTARTVARPEDARLPPRRSLFVMMDVTNRCNLRCRMCPRHLSHPEPRDLDLGLLRKIAAEVFPYAGAVSLSCGAEPLMARHFEAALEIAREAGVPHVDFVTNGTLLDERRIRAVMAAGLRRVMVSVDGATADTYERIRAGARFDRVLANLRLLRRLKAEAGTPYPRLRLHFVLMRSNLAELPAYLDLARELGAAEVDLRHVAIYAGLGMEGESLAGDRAAANAALRAARWQAIRHGLVLEAPPPFLDVAPPLGRAEMLRWRLETLASAAANACFLLGRGGAPSLRHLLIRAARRRLGHRVRCPVPTDTLVLTVEGDVLPCPFWYDEEPMGNLARASFADVWTGPGYADLRARLRGELPLARACQRCPSVGSRRVTEDAFQSI